jgi:hypothetical protein
MMTATFLFYRGAVYRKAADPPVLEEQYMRAAWNALQHSARKYRKYLQTSVIDPIVADADKQFAAAFNTANQAHSISLFNDFLTELEQATGAVDLPTKKKIKKMASVLNKAVSSGAISDAVLLDLFGWQPAKMKFKPYRDMTAYFDPTKQEGAAYLKEVIKRLEPLI